MAKNGSIAQELKALGMELASAFNQARASKEFKELEKDIAFSAKKISASVVKSVQAARKSEAAQKIKHRVGKVAKMSAKKGGAEAAKARAAAEVKIKHFSKTLSKLSKKIGK